MRDYNDIDDKGDLKKKNNNESKDKKVQIYLLNILLFKGTSD
ncbi:14820_t:CDS:2 [Entrophospora sp. SA101]|nr:14820_t:CDS:2 [Entrophospora sp. SA101]CAJ0841029.1 390_t:CDS:2 [Entrophospora sp. SA101]CAJ0917862.1 15144_t:CDS:2 [Entrophospora sp. SA101]